MAIVIPSSKIYEKQNQKVRDNSIERIEVNAQEVLPDNERDVAVYNESINKGFISGNIEEDVEKGNQDYGWKKILKYSFYSIEPIYLERLAPNYSGVELYIEKNKDNKWIENISTDNIQASVHYKKYNGTITAQIVNISNDLSFDVSFGTPTYNEYYETGVGQLSPSLKYEYTSDDGAGNKISIEAKVDFNNKEKTEPPIFEDRGNFYYLKFIVFAGYEEIMGGGHCEYEPNYGYIENEKYTSYCTKIIPDKVDITVNGNTVGIRLQDKTVYINGNLQKRVYSVESNELMQTSNYINVGENILTEGVDYIIQKTTYSVDNNVYYNVSVQLLSAYDFPVYVRFEDSYTPTIEIPAGDLISKTQSSTGDYPTIYKVYFKTKRAIEESFYKTQKFYEKGKETATIRCSINDYYDYESGEKVISIEDTSLPMSFKIYDKVIPMVYNSKGADEPMAKLKDGSPKVFKVLGRRIFYDGAVWQELYLQED